MIKPNHPTILRNLYAKLEVMEKELNENSGSLSSPYNNNNNDNDIQKPVEEQRVPNPNDQISPSPLSLPSNNNIPVNVIDKFSNLSLSEQRTSSLTNPNNSTQQLRIQNNNFNRVRSDSNSGRGRISYYPNTERDTELNSPKINYIRASQVPQNINTYYNQQNPKIVNSKSFTSEDDTLNLESPYETDIPRYVGGNYGSSIPQNFQSLPSSSTVFGSPSGNSYALSPESTTFCNEMSIPNIDEYGNYIVDNKHHSDYSGKNDYSKASISNSFDLNADLEVHARSFGAGNESISESLSDTKSFLANVSEIDMKFDPDILKGKGKKYMKDLVNSNNFHKGGKLTVVTNIFLNKKKTLFYALTTHRLYAFKEDRSDAELITYYVIDKDVKVHKAGIYAGVRNFELTTTKDNGKSREVYEFECDTKDEKDEWIHSISKVVQLHKYYEKTLPALPEVKPEVESEGKDKSYTSTLKTPNMAPAYPTPSMSPDGNSSFYGGSNSSFSSSYKSPSISANQYIPQNSFSKPPSMYSNPVNNGRRTSPQPLLVSNPAAVRGSSPNMNPIQTQIGSPTFNYMNKSPKNLPINQLINNQQQPPIQVINTQQSPVQGRNPQQSPRVNYYQRSPMQRPQSSN